MPEPELHPPVAPRMPLHRLVAIGASAGGLAAIEGLFDALPAVAGTAFVVVQHLAADHASTMDVALARHTTLAVQIAEDGLELAPDVVYLIPAGKTMTLEGCRLRLAPKPAGQLVLPIDLFLRSAASTFRERLVAVILSGTGSDGSRGATAVKDAGGYVIAQHPDSARFDGMSRSAIATGMVDAVLDVQDIGVHLAKLLGMPLASSLPTQLSVPDGAADDPDALAEVLHLLEERSGIVFREYKPSTLHRRVVRRMQVCGVDSLRAYLEWTRGHADELEALQRDLLIPVTMFFRDGEAFEVLRAQAIEAIVRAADAQRPIRIWVAGCATGEEAYSIAMLFDEACAEARRWPGFKLFATDAEERCLATASAGCYPQGIAAEVAEQRLARYFDARGDGYAVRRELRRNLVFARHNVVEDPPFTHIDLICCRNLLIYLQPDAQERVLRRFQYALRPGGFLFLGASESLGLVGRDFETVDARAKLYRVRFGRVAAMLAAAPSLRARSAAEFPAGVTMQRSPDLEVIEQARAGLAAQYVPPTLLLGERLELIDVFGDVQQILAFREGRVSLDAPGLLPPAVAPLIKMLAHRVAKDLEPARVDHVALAADGSGPQVAIVMRPLSRAAGAWPMLASFEPDRGETPRPPGTPLDLAVEAQARNQSLEHELAHTRDNLQATIEELETSNEELQTTNEELMATNEELQSTNEELQSVNEELTVVNAENQERIDLLKRANTDLDGLSRATRVPTVFLDAGLKLTRFTLEATRLFGFRDSDLGRPLSDFSSVLDYPLIEHDLGEAVAHGAEANREVAANDGRWFQVRVLPCAAAPGVDSRVVVTFNDITSLRNVNLLQAVLDSLPKQVAVVDVEGIVQLANAAWAHGAVDGRALTARPPVGGNYLMVFDRALGEPDAVDALVGLRAVMSGALDQYRLRYRVRDGNGERPFMMHVRPLRQPGGGVVVSHVDLAMDEQPAPGDLSKGIVHG